MDFREIRIILLWRTWLQTNQILLCTRYKFDLDKVDSFKGRANILPNFMNILMDIQNM